MFKKSIGLIMSIVMILSLSGCAWGPGLSDYSYDLAGDYELIRSSGDQISISHKGDYFAGVHIDAKVVEVAWNDRYIIAKQFGFSRDYTKAEWIWVDENKVKYWIIDAHTDTLYGGYNLEEFKEKQKELNIYGKLKLRSVDWYKGK